MWGWSNNVRRLLSGLLLAAGALCAQTLVVGSQPVVARVDRTVQGANIGSTLLYTVPSSGAGTYRVSCYVSLTQAATTSSTMPSCGVSYSDLYTNVTASPTVTTTSAANTVGTVSGATTLIHAKAGTAINYSTAGYVSSGATPMQYATHVKLEYLGQ
jgi:hypothetical protein